MLLTFGAAAQERCRSAAALAGRIAEGASGTLVFDGELALDADALENGRLAARVRLRLPAKLLRLMHGPNGWAQLCISLVADDGGGLNAVHHEVVSAVDLDRAAALDYGVDLDLPADTAELIALVELPALGVWGAVSVEERDDPLPPPGPKAVALGGPTNAWYRIIQRTRSTAPVSGAGFSVVELVPPRRQPVAGATRIYALVSTADVDRVAFSLDGEPVGARGHEPFYATVPLARPARTQTVRAVAYDRAGRELGEDELIVNPQQAPFRVRIHDLAGTPASGSVTVAAEVAVPAGAQLQAVEIFRNETRIARLEKPPFRARVPTPSVRATDFVRVAATLTDGRTIDDVVLLATPGLAERVDVNLVPLFAVVRGPKGAPLGNLEQAAFTLKVAGHPQPIQGFRIADDVPLVLGLVIDTSGSMTLVMDDTRRAAVGFLSKILGDGDRGFVVDFDKQPHLRQATTTDMVALLRAVGMLEAHGQTSLYDAVVFAMLQFEQEGGRRALVVLTDGVDVESRFGPRACIAHGERLGVPVYLIAMQTYGREKLPRKELRRVAEGTGGGLFFIDSIDDLPATYDRIERELRSQYALSFYTDGDLSAPDRASIEVSVAVPGSSVRVVVGSHPR